MRWYFLALLMIINGIASGADAESVGKPKLLPDNTIDVSAFRSLQEANDAGVATGRIITVTAPVTVTTDTVVDKTL